MLTQFNPTCVWHTG